MVFNNEVTYDTKWETPENQKYLDKLKKKYFSRTPCSSGIPLGWAKEVWEFLEDINKKFGIAYYPHNTMPLCIGNLKRAKNEYKEAWEKLKDLRWGSFFRRVILFLQHVYTINYCSGLLLYYKILNFILKPKIEMSQIKEKFGYLTVYYNAEDYINNYIRDKITDIELKLSLKGAYYPIKELWNLGQRIDLDKEGEDNWWKNGYIHKDDSNVLIYVRRRDKIRDLARDKGGIFNEDTFKELMNK